MISGAHRAAASHDLPPDRVGSSSSYQADESLKKQTIDCHLAVLNGVANRHITEAAAASDVLIDFVDSMFDVVEREIDRRFFDIAALSH